MASADDVLSPWNMKMVAARVVQDNEEQRRVLARVLQLICQYQNWMRDSCGEWPLRGLSIANVSDVMGCVAHLKEIAIEDLEALATNLESEDPLDKANVQRLIQQVQDAARPSPCESPCY